ncbi:MAG: hypothetical protein H0T62_13585 [Parachlamydiaceae bacterium]|nr:hypothetical protein [Parachlamydiaceae bacterium]
MASLSIKNLDSNIYEKLSVRAARHGISMEEEVRQILYLAVASPEKMSTVFQKYFGLENGINLEIPDQRKPHNPVSFDK